jgi:hypothetical protein
MEIGGVGRGRGVERSRCGIDKRIRTGDVGAEEVRETMTVCFLTEADDAVPPCDAMDDISLEPAVVIAGVLECFDSPDESSGLPTDFPDVVPAADWVSGKVEETLCLIGVQVCSALEPCCKVGLCGFHKAGRGGTGAEGTAGATQGEGEEASGGCVREGGWRARGRDGKGAGQAGRQGVRKGD